jgi:hypothetical protein
LLILRATAPTMLMVVTDWLGWWWWVYIVWRRTDHDLSLFRSVYFFLFFFFCIFFSSVYSRCVCALDLAWEQEERERERCAFVYYRLKRGETYNDLRTFIYIYIYVVVYTSNIFNQSKKKCQLLLFTR